MTLKIDYYYKYDNVIHNAKCQDNSLLVLGQFKILILIYFPSLDVGTLKCLFTTDARFLVVIKAHIEKVSHF